ncbi:LANO_0H00562g1_1 [Lachancea nothofagi CBS 11611]|uniref:Geranylgeranyl transferase type-2 subunit beta n=1 Tax=Lachancea nothofagi CBS 11611 TaxID=1266666 RepID=A0A1G4KKP0_9SACH|nr:LANO_0H00562g1_1 [Lachancea nothofagi CBS 11611]
MLKLDKESHIGYISSLDSKRDDYEYWLSEHLRLNGVYWGLTALCVLGAKDTFDRTKIIEFVQSCWDSKAGGFGAFPGHDAHVLTTLSGIQILAIYDALDVLTETPTDEHTKDRKTQCVEFFRSNQLPDGSFQGDRFGEVDTRFVYAALNGLSILGKLTPDVVDPAVEFIQQCYNFDGGFGLCPGAESHAAMALTCLAALAIVNKLGVLSSEQIEDIGWWLCERQVPEGGLNGRPSKHPDVCYSWWVSSSLAIIGKLDWINFDKLRQFILQSQDLKKGGISDRPDNEVDVFHTCFGVTGLSLLGKDDLVEIDPVYCMPASVTQSFKKYPY